MEGVFLMQRETPSDPIRPVTLGFATPSMGICAGGLPRMKLKPYGLSELSVPRFPDIVHSGDAPKRWICRFLGHIFSGMENQRDAFCRRCNAHRVLRSVNEVQAMLNRDFNIVSGINDINQ